MLEEMGNLDEEILGVEVRGLDREAFLSNGDGKLHPPLQGCFPLSG